MIPVESPHLEVASQSHPGETGKNNEDALSVTAYRLETDETPVLVAIIADGVGGHRAGEVASRMVVDIVAKRVGESTANDPLATLRSAIVEASRAVATAAEGLPEQRGMASTIAVAWVLGRRLYTAYVGDSRIYLHRHRRTIQTTVDHTWVQEALEHNVITPAEAKNHPNAHILRRYLGGQIEVVPDFRLRLSPVEKEDRSIANQGVELEPGDRILLCTDGLTDLVSDDEIEAALREGTPTESVASLVVLARARGGHDNITTVLIAVPPPVQAGRRPLVWLAAAGLLALCLALVLAALWFGLWPGR